MPPGSIGICQYQDQHHIFLEDSTCPICTIDDASDNLLKLLS